MNAASIIPTAFRGYGRLAHVADHLRSPLLLAVRLYWGWQFFITGRGKLLDLPKVAGFFKDLGIPMPMLNAVLAATTECVGGLLLMVGLCSRLTAIPLIITMVVAYLTADSDAVKAIWSDSNGFVTAAPFLFLFASLLVLVFGPGAFSIDHLLTRKFGKGRLP